ncbi:MAG TPA: SRPBCC family protein [Pseudonocardiaceae bacterium]|nr:SRPBCC family protein [Pseudonocardiaceae bacterium]
MIIVTRDMPIGPAAVFALLADGWSYAGWVVGNSHVRDVDPGWPAPGTRIHHSAGMWPAQIQDVTEVRAVEQDRSLELTARLWWLGTATIRFTLTPLDGGTGTHVEMAEEAKGGPAGLIPARLQALVLRPRNVESLSRLADLAAGRVRLSGRAESGPTT